MAISNFMNYLAVGFALLESVTCNGLYLGWGMMSAIFKKGEYFADKCIDVGEGNNKLIISNKNRQNSIIL